MRWEIVKRFLCGISVKYYFKLLQSKFLCLFQWKLILLIINSWKCFLKVHPFYTFKNNSSQRNTYTHTHRHSLLACCLLACTKVKEAIKYMKSSIIYFTHSLQVVLCNASQIINWIIYVGKPPQVSFWKGSTRKVIAIRFLVATFHIFFIQVLPIGAVFHSEMPSVISEP